MRFGLLLFGGGTEDNLEQALQETIEKARIAREAGFHAVWTTGGHLGRGLQSTLLQARLTAYTGDRSWESSTFCPCAFRTWETRSSSYPRKCGITPFAKSSICSSWAFSSGAWKLTLKSRTPASIRSSMPLMQS